MDYLEDLVFGFDKCIGYIWSRAYDLRVVLDIVFIAVFGYSIL